MKIRSKVALLLRTIRSPTKAFNSTSIAPHCKVQMARGGVNSLFKNLQASLNNHVSIKDGWANSSASSNTLCKPPIQF
jgi:hypothetical protein